MIGVLTRLLGTVSSPVDPEDDLFRPESVGPWWGVSLCLSVFGVERACRHWTLEDHITL